MLGQGSLIGTIRFLPAFQPIMLDIIHDLKQADAIEGLGQRIRNNFFAIRFQHQGMIARTHGPAMK